MTNYIIRRLLLVPVLLFGVTLIIFGMLQFIGPVERSALYVRDFPKNENQIEGIIRKYGLDKPIYEQYWRCWWDIKMRLLVNGLGASFMAILAIPEPDLSLC